MLFLKGVKSEGKEIKVFGESNISKIAEEFNLKVLARIPIEQNMSATVDKGEIESLDAPFIEEAAKAVESL